MTTPIKVVLLRMEHLQLGRLGNAYFVDGEDKLGVAYYPNISTALWKMVERLTVDSNIDSLKKWAAAVEEKMLTAIKTCHEAATKLDVAVRRLEQRGRLVDVFPPEPKAAAKTLKPKRKK